MKVLLDANAYSLLMRGHGEGRGEVLFSAIFDPRSHAKGREGHAKAFWVLLIREVTRRVAKDIKGVLGSLCAGGWLCVDQSQPT